MTLSISPAGRELIKSFEAYMRRLPDGRCAAYQEVLGHRRGRPVLDIPTIGWGCTEGVSMGDIWTRDQAEAAFTHELAKHEAIVTRLVTYEMTQGMFDALVSFNYNCGRLSSSTLLKKVNAGDTAGAAREFGRYTKAGGVELRGLVRRRAAEKALFLSEDEPEHSPQQADTPTRDTSHAIVAGAGAVVAGGGTQIANFLSSPDVGSALDAMQAHIGQVEQARDLSARLVATMHGISVPLFAGVAVLALCLIGYETLVRRR